MKLRLFAATLLAAVSFAGAQHASATTLNVAPDGSWQSFFFDEVPGSSFLDDYAFNSPGLLSFSATLSAPAFLRVTDAGLPGDRFAIQVDGASFGSTSTASASGSYTFDFDEAFNSGAWSHGQWLLSAGAHVITGSVLDAPQGPGFGGLQISAVPEPESWTLMLAGLGAMAGVLRHRRNTPRGGC